MENVESAWDARKRIWGEIFFRKAFWVLDVVWFAVTAVLWVLWELPRRPPDNQYRFYDLIQDVQDLPGVVIIFMLAIGLLGTLGLLLEGAYRAVRSREVDIDKIKTVKPRLKNSKCWMANHLGTGIGGAYLVRVENGGAGALFRAQMSRLKPQQLFMPFNQTSPVWIGGDREGCIRIGAGERAEIKLGGCEYMFDLNTKKKKYRIGLEFYHKAMDQGERAWTKWVEYDMNETQLTEPAVDVEVTFSADPDLDGLWVRKLYNMTPMGITEDSSQ